MLEIWQIIDQAVHENRFHFRGKKYQLPDVPQAIRLHHPRRLETFFVAWSPDIIKYAISVDAVPFCSAGWGNTAALQSLRQHVHDQYAQAGADFSRRRFAAQRYVFVSDDASELRRAAEGFRYVGRCGGHLRVGTQLLEGHFIADRPLAGEPTIDAILDGTPIGSAATVAERIVREIRTVGITDLSCFMWPAGMASRAVLRSMERFGAEVLPAIRKELAADSQSKTRNVA